MTHEEAIRAIVADERRKVIEARAMGRLTEAAVREKMADDFEAHFAVGKQEQA